MILIQCRSGSTRLPKKWEKKLGNGKVIDHIIENVKSYPYMFVIPYFDDVKDYLRDKFIPYYEGAEEDVLTRFYRCAKTYKLKRIVRITADCPFLNPAELFYIYNVGNNFDYFSNCIAPCTDGNEIESISFKLLEYMNLNHISEEEREHVTLGVRSNPNINGFKIGYYKQFFVNEKCSIDTEDDLNNCNKILKDFNGRKNYLSDNNS